MSKTLIIAEKPSVAREIAPLVGANRRRDGYIEGNTHLVSWAVGHLVGIAEPEEQHSAWKGRWNLEQLPIIPPQFTLSVLPDARKQFTTLNTLLSRDEITTVVNATDAGREGELIFRRIYLVAGCNKPVKRLWANDMTEKGLKKSLAKLLPGEKKRNLGLAAFARAEADWLIGMNFSRLFTIKAGSLVSVGRVQTPVLKLLADRRRDIEHFIPKDYWTVEAGFSRDETTFTALWHAPPEHKETRIDTLDVANAIVTDCTGKEGVVASMNSRKGSTKPPLPFDLTTLQREANTRFGYSAKDTLAIAQTLYEQKKLITYPRTDSRYLTKELFGEVLTYFRAIYHLYTDEVVPAVDRVKEGKKFPCVNDKKVSDHHAIIPTAQKANLTQLSGEEKNIYDMVCRRFIAAFSAEATYASSTVTVTVKDHTFIAKGKVFKHKGWLLVEPWRTAEDNPLPALRKGSKVTTSNVEANKRQTKAPAHFTDASLLGAMETAGKFVDDEALRSAMKERGLGTPATRAQIIETLLNRGYVSKQGKKLVCSESGLEVISIVGTLLPDVVSPELTGQWEKRLKDIEAAKYTYPEFMQSIRSMVARGVGSLKSKNVRDILVATKARSRKDYSPDGNCPLCGGKILEQDKAFGCENWKRENGRCLFTIWKNTLGKTITQEIVHELLGNGRTTKPMNFVSKAGKPYRAFLVIRDGRVQPEFVNEQVYPQKTQSATDMAQEKTSVRPPKTITPVEAPNFSENSRQVATAGENRGQAPSPETPLENTFSEEKSENSPSIFPSTETSAILPPEEPLPPLEAYTQDALEESLEDDLELFPSDLT